MTPNSRSYINHFTQPDSIIPNPTNPLAWNRYLYVLANPLRYTDPSGHAVSCEDGDVCKHPSSSSDPVELTHVGDPIPGTDDVLSYGGGEFAQLYELMMGCTTCWWYANGGFTFEQFVGILLMHEGNGNFLFSMLNAFAGAQQLFIGGGGNGAFGPYCPSGTCHNGVFNYFAAFSESARNLVDIFVRGGADVRTMEVYGRRTVERVLSESATFGAAMLHPKPTEFTHTRQPIGHVTWYLDPNADSGLSDYGSGMDTLVQKLLDAGLQPYTYYPGGKMGIYYFTALNDGASVWLSVDGVNTWMP